MMQIKEKIENDIAVLTLNGSLQSEPDAILLREAFSRCVEKKVNNIVIDMGNMNYLNSWGLGLLVSLLSMIRKQGGDVRLARILGNVQSLFLVTQLTKVFRTYDDVQTAVSSFNHEHHSPSK